MAKMKEKYSCSLVMTHDLIGGKWKLLILWHIIQGDNQFSKLKRKMRGITEKVLYSNLRELEKSGVIYKEVRDDQSVRTVYYYLEEEYLELKDIVIDIHNFSSKYARIKQIDFQ